MNVGGGDRIALDGDARRQLAYGRGLISAFDRAPRTVALLVHPPVTVAWFAAAVLMSPSLIDDA